MIVGTRRTVKKHIAIIQVRDYGDSDQGGSSGDVDNIKI